MGQRLNWIDVTRGIAFLMVIYSHLEYTNNYLMHFFSPIFLTTFFFISGYLFKESYSFKQVLEQRTRTLLLPFLILGLSLILLSSIFSFHEHFLFAESIKGLIFQNGKNQLLWFIAALYIYSLFFYWVANYTKNILYLTITIIILFIFNNIYLVWLNGPHIPWHISTIGFGCFYMGLGRIYVSFQNWRID